MFSSDYRQFTLAFDQLGEGFPQILGLARDRLHTKERLSAPDGNNNA